MSHGTRKVQEEVQKFVTDAGGIVTFVKDAEKTKLSYSVNHQRFSNFGYIHFSLENGEALAGIDEHMRLHGSIMTHLMQLKLPTDLEKSKRMAKQAKIQETMSRKASRAKPVEKEPTLETKEIDQSISV